MPEVRPAYANEIRRDVPPNPVEGEMLAAELTRDGQLKDPAAANRLAAKIRAERAERIRTQGHA